MGNGYIQKVWAQNKMLLKQHNIVVGTILRSKYDPTHTETITSIHPMYGWLSTHKGDSQKVPQRASEALQSYTID